MTAMRLPLATPASEDPPEKAVALSKRLRDCLRFRYAWPEWALLEEISLASGSLHRYGIADAVALGMWGSSHNHLHGFEIKASRSDWLREVRTVGKADAAYRHCHRWWLVAPESVVDPSEIPGTWGWLIPHGTTLRIKRQAPILTPEPLTMGAIAHLVYTSLARGSKRPGTIEEEIATAYNRGKGDGIEDEKRRYHPGDLEELRTAVDRFEEASGVRIEKWDGAALGEAVKFVEGGGLKRQEEKLGYAAQSVLEALVALSRVVPQARTFGGHTVDLKTLLAGVKGEDL